MKNCTDTNCKYYDEWLIDNCGKYNLANCHKKNKNPQISDLSNVTPGDWIFTICETWIRIIAINPDDPYPIVTLNSSTRTSTYTLEGYFALGDALPSAWTYNPFDPTDQPPVEFIPGEVIMVRDNSSEMWLARIFKDKKYKYIDSFGNQWNFARKLTPTERGES